MIVAIICLTLTSAMAISLVRLTLASHQQVEREHWRLQAAWLAEAGLSRGIARLRADAAYSGETWSVENIGGASEDGAVTIAVAAGLEDDALLTITATADYPAGPADRTRTTCTLTIRRSDDGPASQVSEE